ncbi:MAG: squalene synthase HpnC [Phycisphaerales bacterium]|nr:squalene synthase HpnC [Phycisphaerales bacterium]
MTAATLTPEPAAQAEASFRACMELALSHYENFSVISRLLPREHERDFAAVYAFCRTADDAADERASKADSLAELAEMHRQVDRCAAGGVVEGPYFPALAVVMSSHGVPAELFHRLLDAFERDQRQTRYETWEDLLTYCTGSADPVGRIVLLITGHGDRPQIDEMFRLSDCTCTALQLTNFWQDVVRDLLERHRIYIPAEMMREHGVSEAALQRMIERRQADESFRSLERTLAARTQPLFDEGKGLWPHLRPPVRPAIQLFTAGGESILRAIRRQRYDVIMRRPTLSRLGKAALAARAWIGLRLGLDVFRNG